MADASHKGGVSFYIIVALILGAITYVEFAIVEYEVAWLSDAATLVLLVLLSLVKFALVVAIYMHLRDDPRAYTGFFASGMVFALATFVALWFLFTVRSAAVDNSLAQRVEEVAAGSPAEPVGHGEAEGNNLLLELERPALERLRVPEPKRQNVLIPLPSAPDAEFRLVGAGTGE